MLSMDETVSVRLPNEVVEALDELGNETGRTRLEVLREVVQRGLVGARLERGLEAYRRGDASVGKANKDTEGWLAPTRSLFLNEDAPLTDVLDQMGLVDYNEDFQEHFSREPDVLKRALVRFLEQLQTRDVLRVRLHPRPDPEGPSRLRYAIRLTDETEGAGSFFERTHLYSRLLTSVLDACGASQCRSRLYISLESGNV